MSRKCLTFGILLGFLSIPGINSAADWEGSIQGLMCVNYGKICPENAADPLIKAESTFVLLTKEWTWFLLPNVGRKTLARHINQSVQVEGEKHPRYNAISVRSFKVEKKGEWKNAWSPELEWRSRGRYPIGPVSR